MELKIYGRDDSASFTRARKYHTTARVAGAVAPVGSYVMQISRATDDPPPASSSFGEKTVHSETNEVLLRSCEAAKR
jgi:hypothetical protein